MGCFPRKILWIIQRFDQLQTSPNEQEKKTTDDYA